MKETRLIKKSFLLLIGNVLGRFSMFVTNIIVARYLSIDMFGKFSMIRNTISMIEGFFSGTLGALSIKKISEDENKNKILNLFIINFSFAFVLSCLILFLAPSLVELLGSNDKQLLLGLRLGSFLLLNTTLASYMQSVLIAKERYLNLVIASFIVTVIYLPLLYFIFIKLEIVGALLGVSSYFLLDFFIKLLFVIKYDKLKFYKEDFLSELKDILKNGYPMIASSVLTGGTFWYSKVLVVRSNAGFIDIAIFDAAFQWLTIIMIITGATTSVVLPVISRLSAKSNLSDLIKTTFLTIKLNSLLTVLFFFFCLFFAESIMRIYGEEYVDGNNIMIILSIVAIFFSISSILNKLVIALNMTKLILFASIIGSISMFSIIFIFSRNAFTLALSFVVYYLSQCIFYIIFLKSKKNVFVSN